MFLSDIQTVTARLIAIDGWILEKIRDKGTQDKDRVMFATDERLIFRQQKRRHFQKQHL